MKRILISLIFACTVATGGVSTTGCAFGRVADAGEERLLLLDALFGSLRGRINLPLRLYDGGLDELDRFTEGGVALRLSGLNFLELDRLELIYERTDIFTPAQSRAAGDSRARHETDASGQALVAIPLDRIVRIPTSGELPSEVDSGGRPYHEVRFSADVPPGRFRIAILHVRRLALSGSADSLAFSYFHDAVFDARVALRCALSLAVNGELDMPLVLNYSRFFAGLSPSSAGNPTPVIDANLTNPTLLQEHECITF